MEQDIRGPLMFKLAITTLDDGVLLEIQTRLQWGTESEVYRGAFAGLEAIQSTANFKLECFFAEARKRTNQAPR